ncbi:hypothetical protein THAOC_27527 [Thalassiosira oceanica]|uniref:Uncharacterized protein n=1 Tax=Thalassiosira oceanica TaxID=159749 RepID=K0RLE9_THAOC|nr:hypothetical protein THAOC_27527 [Thalassiosira oceanica]|eukprot:EJK53104.1 hypothetical protein THAOC_27527 [Thalassiosira oceanica]
MWYRTKSLQAPRVHRRPSTPPSDPISVLGSLAAPGGTSEAPLKTITKESVFADASWWAQIPGFRRCEPMPSDLSYAIESRRFNIRRSLVSSALLGRHTSSGRIVGFEVGKARLSEGRRRPPAARHDSHVKADTSDPVVAAPIRARYIATGAGSGLGPSFLLYHIVD